MSPPRSTASTANNAHRLWLTRAIKLMSLVAVAGFSYVLYATVPSTAPSPPSPALRVPLRGLAPGAVRMLHWDARPIIVLHRTPAMAASLARQDGLAHPVPARHSAYFVAIDRGAGLGCPLRYVPAGAAHAPRRPWPGGFRDTCSGSWYDAAGRVFSGQTATRNLRVPPHRFGGDDTLVLGH